MHRRITLHIRQGKVAFAVASISRSEKREQGRILTERQYLTIAKGPAFRRKVKWKNANFSYKWVHGLISLALQRNNPEERDDEVNTQVRLKIIVRLTASCRPDRARTQLHQRCVRSVRRY